MTTIAYSAHCQACEWTHEGDDSDSKAQAHTRRTGHSTITRGVAK